MKLLMVFSFMYMKLKFIMFFFIIVLIREIYLFCIFEIKRRKFLSKKGRLKLKVVIRLKFGVKVEIWVLGFLLDY